MLNHKMLIINVINNLLQLTLANISLIISQWKKKKEEFFNVDHSKRD